MRVYTTLCSLRFHRRAFTCDLRKKLVESLIFPYFDYASAVFQDLNATLSKLLNASVRFVIDNIPTRFSRVGSHILLRRSERRQDQSLYFNFLRPEIANGSFKRAAKNLLNGLNFSTYVMSELSRLKTRLYQTLLDKINKFF